MTLRDNPSKPRRAASAAGGPRSSEGKKISSQNALKTGFRAKSVVNTKLGELPKEFDAFLKLIRKELGPVGVIEEVITERLASICWRLRRLSKMEFSQSPEAWSKSRAVQWDEILRDALQTVENRQSLSPEQLAALESVPVINYSKLLLYDSMLKKKKLYPALGPAEPAKDLLEQLNAALRVLEDVKVPEYSIVAPTQINIDLNISRYEVALSRQLYKAIGELERLQRLRKGDYVPPPIKLAMADSD
jgi:hypothetical protein